MGLNGRNLNAFRRRIDAALCDIFPAELWMQGKRVDGSGPGGRTVTDYVTGGESENFRFPFRVPMALLNHAPEVGDSLEWQLDNGKIIPLEILECPERPHEDAWSFTCKKRRVP